MALMELTDKCLGENDPNDELFDELYKALLAIENNTRHDNLAFWYYQYQILAKLGFQSRCSCNLVGVLYHVIVQQFYIKLYLIFEAS